MAILSDLNYVNRKFPTNIPTYRYLVILLAKIKISITVDNDLIKWIDSQIEKKKFANRSHGFEYAISELKEKS